LEYPLIAKHQIFRKTDEHDSDKILTQRELIN